MCVIWGYVVRHRANLAAAFGVLLIGAAVVVGSTLSAEHGGEVSARRATKVASQVTETRLRAERYLGQLQLYRDQIAACQRGNKLRAESNRRIRDHEDDTLALRIFVLETRRARADRTGSSYDPHFVSIIDHRILPLLDRIHFGRTRLVDCRAIITHPVRRPTLKKVLDNKP